MAVEFEFDEGSPLPLISFGVDDIPELSDIMGRILQAISVSRVLLENLHFNPEQDDPRDVQLHQHGMEKITELLGENLVDVTNDIANRLLPQ